MSRFDKKALTIILDALAVVFGTALGGFGFAYFTIPNNIAPGGVSGFATAIAHVTGGAVGSLSLLFNLPLLFLSWRKFGVKPLLKTIVGTVLFSVFVDLFSACHIAYTNNVLLAAVMAGACIGGGLGLIFLRNFTTGGTDLIVTLLKDKVPHIPSGQFMMYLDVFVVAVAVLVFRDIEVALYSAVTAFVTSKVIDSILQGVDYAKVLFVVTENEEQVIKVLFEKTQRGVTVLNGRGGYTNVRKGVIMMAVRKREVPRVLKAIKEADPNSFTILTSASEVRGAGFKEG